MLFAGRALSSSLRMIGSRRRRAGLSEGRIVAMASKIAIAVEIRLVLFRAMRHCDGCLLSLVWSGSIPTTSSTATLRQVPQTPHRDASGAYGSNRGPSEMPPKRN